MENKRRKIHEQLEVVQVGFANGVADLVSHLNNPKNIK